MAIWAAIAEHFLYQELLWDQHLRFYEGLTVLTLWDDSINLIIKIVKNNGIVFIV